MEKHMPKLTREDLIEAATEGAKRAFVEMFTDDGNLAIVTAKDVFDAIREGVAHAIWRVATNATDMPTADFFDSVKEGMRDGVSRMSLPD